MLPWPQIKPKFCFRSELLPQLKIQHPAYWLEFFCFFLWCWTGYFYNQESEDVDCFQAQLYTITVILIYSSVVFLRLASSDPFLINSCTCNKNDFPVPVCVFVQRTDPQLLAQFYYADEELNQVATELDGLDGRKDPQRCTLLVNQFRSCQVSKKKPMHSASSSFDAFHLMKNTFWAFWISTYISFIHYK